MPISINKDSPDLKRIKTELDWRQLVKAQMAGGDAGFDQKWSELYGALPDPKTARPPMKNGQS